MECLAGIGTDVLKCNCLIRMRERLTFDKQGKELRRYEGVQKLPRGWAVTTNYVIHTGSMGDFRVFDRATGKKLGDANVGLRPFALYTITGNDVLLYDDRADKLYRVDF